MDDSASSGLQFSVLGPMRAWRDHAELDLGSPQQRATFAVLLLRAGAAVTMEELVDAVWDGEPPRAATGIVRTYVYRLRQVLPEDAIVTAAGGYRMPVGVGELDLTAFRNSVADAGQPDLRPAEVSAVLAQALQRWHGAPLAGLPGPFARAQRAQLEDQRLAVREWMLALEVELGHYPEAVAGLSVLLADHPLRERPRQLLMLALYRSGQQAEALATFQDARKALAAERGISPGPEIQDLHRRILEADPGLLPTVERRRPLATWSAAPQGMVVSEETRAPRTLIPDAPARSPAQLPLDLPDFTGRADLVTELTRTLVDPNQPGRSGRIPIVGLHGPAGIGKTTLAVRVGHLVRPEFPDGQVFLDLTSTERPWTPHAVLGALLRAVGVPDREQPDDLRDRTRRWQNILAGRRLLIVLDQVVDRAQIGSALSTLTDSEGSAVILTSRQRIADLPQVRWHRLDGLPVEEGLALLARIAGPPRVQTEPAAARRLLAVCDHLPRSIRSAAAHLASRPAWSIAALTAQIEANGEPGQRRDQSPGHPAKAV